MTPAASCGQTLHRAAHAVRAVAVTAQTATGRPPDRHPAAHHTLPAPARTKSRAAAASSAPTGEFAALRASAAGQSSTTGPPTRRRWRCGPTAAHSRRGRKPTWNAASRRTSRPRTCSSGLARRAGHHPPTNCTPSGHPPSGRAAPPPGQSPRAEEKIFVCLCSMVNLRSILVSSVWPGAASISC